VLRPLARLLLLAFFAFGAGSLMLSGLQLGLVPTAETRSVAIVQAAFVFPPMALASVLASLSRETLGAKITALISASRLANGLIDLTTPPASPSATQGLLALASARFATAGLCELTAAAALGLEDLQGKTVLPIGRRGAARRAFEGDLGEQVGPVESEAGVRKQP
jgi:uncharacterized protein